VAQVAQVGLEVQGDLTVNRVRGVPVDRAAQADRVVVLAVPVVPVDRAGVQVGQAVSSHQNL